MKHTARQSAKSWTSTSWIGQTNPFVRGGWSVVTPGNLDARTTLAEPLGERVWFAGEATSIRSSGTAHGAWQSGIDATNRIAFALGRLTSEPVGSDTDDIFRFDF